MKKQLALIGILAILAGCAGSDNEIVAEQSLPEIYEMAYAEFNDEDYEAAAMEFLRAETQHPASPWAADALIMAAYSHYMDGDFAGALLATDRFMRFHPGHRDVPYVMYLRGMCYYRQVSDVRREPGMSAYALTQFQTLVQRFPTSEYAKNAENKINILKNYIAGKVMYSARNDMRVENWPNRRTRRPGHRHDARGTIQIDRGIHRNRPARPGARICRNVKIKFPRQHLDQKVKIKNPPNGGFSRQERNWFSISIQRT